MKGDMATYEDLVKCGYLEMKLPRKQRKVAQKAWKRKWFVLRRNSKRGKTRLEYYHSEKGCTEGKHKTVIPLYGVTSINNVHSRTHEHAFQIAAYEVKLFLSGNNELDTNEWILLMKELVLPEPKMFPSVQGGDIYGLYEVSVIQTDDSERIGLSGDYLITVRKEYLCLHSTKTGSEVMKWELEYLPRFRLQRLSHLQDIDKVLVIKAASNCKSGQGEFHFLSRQGREILESIKCQTQRLFSLRSLNINRPTHVRRQSVDSVPCTRSSGNETNDSLTSASCYDTESRERSISMSSHPSSQSGQQSSDKQSPRQESSEKQSPESSPTEQSPKQKQLPGSSPTHLLPKQRQSSDSSSTKLSAKQQQLYDSLPKEVLPKQQLPLQRPREKQLKIKHKKEDTRPPLCTQI